MELVREWYNFGGWYDTEQPCFNLVEGMSFICSYTYPNLSEKNDKKIKLVPGFSDRNLRNFFTLFLDDLDKQDFINILKLHYISVKILLINIL